MIYLDSSVLLASVLREPRSPPVAFWEEELTSSRLLEYEVRMRLNAYGLALSHGDLAKARLHRIDFVALSQSALARALEPFPIPLRTLDALHLATAVFLNSEIDPVQLASYDGRMLDAARVLGIEAAEL